MSEKIVKIGGASASYIDSVIAVPQLVGAGVDYIVFDCLGEGVMPVLAQKSATDDPAGLFLSEVIGLLRGSFAEIARRKIKIVANAGGLDPKGCAAALQSAAAEQGWQPRIAYIEGDNLLSRAQELRAAAQHDMFSGATFPEQKITTANAYLGALPVAAALRQGADIVITGRSVDSAASLGPLIHEFDWTADDYDRLAAGTLIGHLLECGAQATGGIFTDWRNVPDWENIGYPIAECRTDGTAVITKAAGTGGLVSIGTVAEQLIYEIGDPQRYFVPDVTCDFSNVSLQEDGENCVRVSGAKGYAPTSTYKALLTYDNGWRAVVAFALCGQDAAQKANRVGQALLNRTNHMLQERGWDPWRASLVEAIGAEVSYGSHARHRDTREVVCRIVVDHPRKEAAVLMLAEHFAAGVSMAPGNACMPITMWAAPQFKLFSIVVDKQQVPATLTLEGETRKVEIPVTGGFYTSDVQRNPPIAVGGASDRSLTVPLLDLAWVRSGDKGNISNVGVIARRAEFLPFLKSALTVKSVAAWYAHLFSAAQNPRVECFELPGIHALNFLLHDALDGGVTAALRFDPMGKAIAQQLLDFPIPIPEAAVALIRRNH